MIESKAAETRKDYDAYQADVAAQQTQEGISILDQAYIDDLITQASSTAEIQAKADLISAFTCVFGITFLVAKLRRMVINPDDTESTTPFTVHLTGWVAHIISTTNIKT